MHVHKHPYTQVSQSTHREMSQQPLSQRMAICTQVKDKLVEAKLPWERRGAWPFTRYYIPSLSQAHKSTFLMDHLKVTSTHLKLG